MAQDRILARIEAKLDALLKERNLKPADYEATTTAATQPRKLTEAEQQAIDNAPETPVGATGPEANAPRTTTLNAPVTPAASEPKRGTKSR